MIRSPRPGLARALRNSAARSLAGISESRLHMTSDRDSFKAKKAMQKALNDRPAAASEGVR